MKTRWQRLWPFAKWTLTLVILLAVGRQFASDLQKLDLGSLEIRPRWIVVSAVLYVAGLSFSAWYWNRLLRICGQPSHLYPAIRAYYVGQLGKYIPGKAVALVIRGHLVGPRVRMGVAVITGFYEVLTTMASGALLAALIFLFLPPKIVTEDTHPFLTGLLIFAGIAVPLMPSVFNGIITRLARKFEHIDSFKIPLLRFSNLLEGMAIAAVGWSLMGLSLWAMLQAVLPEPPTLSVDHWLTLTAANALAYVAGFLAIIMPSGVGVREYLLRGLIEGPEAFVALAVLMLRLAWTVADVVIAGLLYAFKAPTKELVADDLHHRSRV